MGLVQYAIAMGMADIHNWLHDMASILKQSVATICVTTVIIIGVWLLWRGSIRLLSYLLDRLNTER